MSTLFRGVNGQVHQLIAREINSAGYSSISSHLTPEQFKTLQVQISPVAEKYSYQSAFFTLRRLRSNVLLNVLGKTLLQNAVSLRLISAAVRRRLLQPERLQLVPGNLHLFWGYRTGMQMSPATLPRRATAIFHCGDPRAGSLATCLIPRLNQRRARRATAAGAQPTA